MENQELDELGTLKQTADTLGIKYSPNIGLKSLLERVSNHIATQGVKASEPEKPKKKSPNEVRNALRKDAMKLIRIRISSMDPADKDLQGEIFTFANRYLGTVRKFVPFGEGSQMGYHVPKCIYNVLKDKKYNQVIVRKSSQTGREVVTNKWVPKYAIEVLPDLTAKELRQLAAAQKNATVD